MSADQSDRKRWIALGLLALTQFMLISDQTVVNIAIPSIGTDLDISGVGLVQALQQGHRLLCSVLPLSRGFASLLGGNRLYRVRPVLTPAQERNTR